MIGRRVMRAAGAVVVALLAAGGPATGPAAAVESPVTVRPWAMTFDRLYPRVSMPGATTVAIPCPDGYTPVSGSVQPDIVDFTTAADSDLVRTHEYTEFGSGARYEVALQENRVSTNPDRRNGFWVDVDCASMEAFTGAQTVSALLPRQSNNLAEGYVTCPAGWSALSASMDWNGNADRRRIDTSTPTADLRGWYVKGWNATPGTGIYVELHCVPSADLAGARVVQAWTLIGANRSTHSARCPDHTRPIAGGTYQSASNGGAPMAGYASSIYARRVPQIAPEDEYDWPGYTGEGWASETVAASIDNGTYMATTVVCMPDVLPRVYGEPERAGAAGVLVRASGFDDLEAVTSLRCSVDDLPAGGADCSSGQWTFDGPLEAGDHEVQVSGVTADGRGNRSTRSFYVEYGLPTVTFATTNQALWSSGTGSVAFTAADDQYGVGLQSVRCSLDDNPSSSCATPVAATGLADGAHRVVVTATDRWGNVGSGTFDFRVDTTPPTVVVGRRPSPVTTARTAAFTIAASDPGGHPVASTTCQLDSLPATSCPSTTAFTGLAGGTHTFSWSARDLAGNETSGSYTWRIDLAAPTVTITAGPANKEATRSKTASFAFQVADDGPLTEVVLRCTLDGTSAPCTSPAAYADLAGGEHTFTVRATDAAGRTGTASRTWRVAAPPR